MRTNLSELQRMSAWDLWTWAGDLFESRDYYRAAEVLEHLLATHDEPRELAAARELLARSYYHSAQTGRAADVARGILERDPADAYAALLLTRSLQRMSRTDEAARAQRWSDALA